MKYFALLSFLIILFIFVSYLYYGVTHKPMLGDSHDYHLPIARSFLTGQFLWLPDNINPSIYYPGSSNGILALFLLFSIPVNWFCLLGWMLLFFLLVKLGSTFGLNRYLSLVFGMSFCATQSIIRQIPTQSIDVWIAVFFVWALILLENPQKRFHYFLLLGLALGMIVGSKASGILYIVVLFIVYAKSMIRYLNYKYILAFLLTFSVFGLFWYVRNAMQFGNPLYPADFSWMKGYPGFPLQDMMLYKTPFEKDGLLKIFEALISEYLLWAFSLPVTLLFLYKNRRAKVEQKINKIIYIGLLTALLSLLLPIPTTNIVSNMRYLFPLFIPIILGTFLIAQKYNYDEYIATVAVLNALCVMYNIPFHPKLILLYFVLVGIIIFKEKYVMKKLLSM